MTPQDLAGYRGAAPRAEVGGHRLPALRCRNRRLVRAYPGGFGPARRLAGVARPGASGERPRLAAGAAGGGCAGRPHRVAPGHPYPAAARARDVSVAGAGGIGNGAPRRAPLAGAHDRLAQRGDQHPGGRDRNRSRPSDHVALPRLLQPRRSAGRRPRQRGDRSRPRGRPRRAGPRGSGPRRRALGGTRPVTDSTGRLRRRRSDPRVSPCPALRCSGLQGSHSSATASRGR